MKESRNFVNLNVNPCKVCMPLGAAIAFKGIEKCVMMLHGSQGCSTYIRRHMAAHYNEPVDIASSSLNEKGTVYGGANNLKKGLKNIIKQYNPKVIGIATTCLAETIGEDIERIVQEFVSEEGIEDCRFVSVSSPGYGGSEHQGYYAALRKIVEKFARKSGEGSKNSRRVNVIVGNVTPGDIRRLKEILSYFGVLYTLLPDFSETLDAPFAIEYKKVPEGGTTLEDIEEMGNAVATIEMGMLVGDEQSPGKFLEKRWGIPFYRCPIPIGLYNTDVFVRLLSFITEKPVPEKLTRERLRMIDGLVDSHKFNGEVRAAIFGDPEIVYSVAHTCFQAGIFPCLIATGTKAEKLEEMLKEEINYYSKNKNEDIVVINETDFETIEKYIKDVNVNIMIGNSNGKFITEKTGIPLVRIGFPIHDRMGAQRKVFVGYEGSMSFIDDITNAMITQKLENYRDNMYQSYFKEESV